MGSWDSTCGVSGLPIGYNDKIKVFILSKTKFSASCKKDNPEGGGTCYSDGIWTPYAPAISGYYDTYGAIENIVSTNETTLLLSKLQNKMFLLKDEDEDSNDNTLISNLNLEQVIRYIERDNAKIKTFNGETFLGMFMVLDEVYKTMISFNPVETITFNEESDSNRHYIYMPRKDAIFTKFNMVYKNSYNQVKKFNSSKDQNFEKLVFMSDLGLSTGYLFDDISRYSELMFDFRRRFIDLLKNEVSSDDIKVCELRDVYIESKLFCMAMEDARKLWHPPCMKGSQQNDLNIYSLLNNTIQNIIETRRNENKKNGCDMPNDDGYYQYMIDHNKEMETKYGNR